MLYLTSVAAKGVDIGANQAALLRKIEELTLYIIKQDAELQKARQDLEGPNDCLDRMERNQHSLKH